MWWYLVVNRGKWDKLLQEDNSVNESGSLKRPRWDLRCENAKVFERSPPDLSGRIPLCPCCGHCLH